MNFFAGFLKKNEKKNKDNLIEHTENSVNVKNFTPSEKLTNIADKLESYPQTENLAKELKLLLNSPKTQKADYFRALRVLKAICTEENQKFTEHKQLITMYNNLKLISNENFHSKYNSFENFSEDFPDLVLEFEILDKLFKFAPDIFEDHILNELYAKYKKTSVNFLNAKEESEVLKKEEDALTLEIEKYTDTVSEFSQKYRLSMDWEGKKPLMISLGKKLSDKRRILVEKEVPLIQNIKSLYQIYPNMHIEFINDRQYFINIVQIKIDEYDKAKIHRTEFNEILYALESAIKNI